MRILQQFVVFALKFYKIIISPILEAIFGRACRYEQTCSEYAIKAVEKFGVVKGGKMALKRFLKCNPYKFGYHE